MPSIDGADCHRLQPGLHKGSIFRCLLWLRSPADPQELHPPGRGRGPAYGAARGPTFIRTTHLVASGILFIYLYTPVGGTEIYLNMLRIMVFPVPILPADAGDVRVGFGLWKLEWASITVEAALLLAGACLYWRAASRTERAAGVIRGGRANLVTVLIVVSGLVVLTLDVLTA